MLLVPTPLILSYYSGLALRSSVEDRTSVWNIALTEYVFMAFEMFVINARARAFPRYYTLHADFDSLIRAVLFRSSNKILDALRYIGLFKFAPCMGTDPFLTTLVIHRCTDTDWTKKTLLEGFVSYGSNSGEVFDLKEEIAPATKCACCASVAPTSDTLPVIPVVYRAGILRVTLVSMRCSYEEYCDVGGDLNETSR